MKRNALVTDFTQGNVPRSLLTFALPLYLANLLQIAYNMADMVIVGQAMGKVGLSAVYHRPAFGRKKVRPAGTIHWQHGLLPADFQRLADGDLLLGAG